MAFFEKKRPVLVSVRAGGVGGPAARIFGCFASPARHGGGLPRAGLVQRDRRPLRELKGYLMAVVRPHKCAKSCLLRWGGVRGVRRYMQARRTSLAREAFVWTGAQGTQVTGFPPSSAGASQPGHAGGSACSLCTIRYITLIPWRATKSHGRVCLNCYRVTLKDQ
jgi:hypothetical protein